MGKRKYENEFGDSPKKSKQDINNATENDGGEQPQNVTEPEKVKKRPVHGGFDVKQFRKEISGKQGQTMVLTQFLQVCLNPDNDVDYLLEYLNCGGNSHEILRQINSDNKKNLTLATPAFHLFHLIILKVQASLPHMIAITEEASRYFLNNFMSTVEIMISENSGPRHRKIVLKLLTSMVTLNSDLGIEVLNQAPLARKKLKHIVENTNVKEKDNVRTAFVQFMTSFLVEGHLPLIKALLEKPGLVGMVFSGMMDDDAESVLMFLSILKKNVVDNALISKSMKLVTFSQIVLHLMFKLFSWKGPSDIPYQARNEARAEITVSLTDILLTLFTNHKIGLYFIDHTLGTTELNKNPSLYKALLSLNRPWENDAQSDVILRIIHKSPDLHRAVISIIERSFEPQHTQIWEKTTGFIAKLLEKINPEDVVSRMSSLTPPQVANFVRFITLPIPLLKYIQTYLGTDHSISLYCIKVLVKMLQSLKRYMQILEQQDSPAQILELRNRLENFFPKHLPAPGVIVALMDSVITDIKKEEAETQDYRLPKITNSDALISLVDVLLLYNDIHPSFFETLEGNIDMKKILDYSVTLSDGPESVLKFKVVSLWLTLDNSVISLKNPMFKELLLIMLDVYVRDDEHTWLEAKETLRSFFRNTAIFESDEDEIHLILYTLRSAKVNPPSLVGDIVEYVLENIKELTEYVRNQIVNFEITDENAAASLDKLFNDLMENKHTEDSVFLENKVPSPFIVGCMQFLQQNKEKKKSLKHFLSLYIANLLHSNYSPELTEVLIGDSKLEARNYVASWTGEPVSLPETMVGNDVTLKNISKSIIDNEQLSLPEVFTFIKEVEDEDKDIVINNVAYKFDSECIVDSSKLLTWAKYLIFCTVRLTDMGLLKQEQQNKITDYIQCVIAVGRKRHMIDVCRTIVLNLFKNPHVLKTYKCLDQNKGESTLLATQFLLNIITEHKDIINYLNNKHKLLKSYQQKNYNEIVKGFVKIKKGKEVKSEYTMRVLEVVGLAVEDDLRVFNLIFGAEIANCVKDDKEPSLILDLLRYLIDKYSKSVSLELQSQTIRKCMQLYTELLINKEVNANLTQLEMSLVEYFDNKPHQVKTVSDDLFKKFFEANILRKSTPLLAAVLLKHNIKFSNTFKEQISKPEILALRELTLPLGNAVINHNQFLLENKKFLSTVYSEYKTNINKMLEKPQKAGQVYISNSRFIKKLVLECMDIPECVKLFGKSHKFDAVELSHVHLFQSIFLKLCTSDCLKKDHVTNYFLSTLHIVTVALKEGKDTETVLEIVKDIYYVIKLVQSMGVSGEQRDDFKKILDSAIWQSFCKAVLKDSLKVRTVDQTNSIGPQLLSLLTNLVKLFYSDNHEDINTLFDMITSHSEFLNVMLSYHSSDVKSQLIEFLYTLILNNKSVMKSQQIPVFLSSYHATRSSCDRLILAILYHYESNGLPVNEFKPYVWGDSGANYYSVRKNRSSSLWGHPTPNQILNLFEKDIIERTVRNFPVLQKLDYHYELPSVIDDFGSNVLTTINSMSKDGVFKSAVLKDTEGAVKALSLKGKYHQTIEKFKVLDVSSVSHVEEDEGVYDPVFLFPLLSHLLAPGSVASCFKMLRTGLLSIPVMGLSSHCPLMRAAAYHVLHRFCLLLETETRHKNDKLLLNDFIKTLRQSISLPQNNADLLPSDFKGEKNPRIPSIDALYLARGLMVTTAPFDPLYKPVNNFLIAKEYLDLTVVPDFLSLFHDSDVEANERRLWLLDVVKDGTKTMTDVNVVFKTMCLKMLMDYYSSVLSDKRAKEKILAVLSSLVSVPRSMDILVEGYGLISWLHSVSRQIGKDEKSLFKGVLNVLKNMLSSMKLSSFAKGIAAKVHEKRKTEFIEVKINKDVENEILVILFDCLRNVDILDVKDTVHYLEVFNLLTKRAIKSLNKNLIINLVNKICGISQDGEKFKLLNKALVANDGIILKSAHISCVNDDCLLKELTDVVQTFIF